MRRLARILPKRPLWWVAVVCGLAVAAALWLTWPRVRRLPAPVSHRTGKPVSDPQVILDTARARREIDRAYEAAEKKDWPSTVRHLETAIERNPKSQVSDWAQYQKGIALKASGDCDGAIAAFRELQRRFPDSYLSIRAEGQIRECRERRGEKPSAQSQVERPLGTCGAECLKLICDHYGIAATVEELAKLSETKVEGATFAGLAKAAEAKGLKAEGKIGNLLYLAKAPKPCIVWVNGNHFVLVTRASEKAVWVTETSDKQRPSRKIAATEFERMWAGHTLEVTPPRSR